ncbi:ribonuclease H-like domain-containing protein [Tanacetum coccineum]
MTRKFEMGMMGELTYFLGLQIKQDDKGKSICQEQYIGNLLKKYEISDSSWVKTPIVPPNNLGPDLADPDYAGCNMDRNSTSGACQSTYSHTGTETAYLLLYVDDIVLTASFETLLQQIIASLHQEFSMTDLGSLNYFLGNYVTCDSSGMFLSQRKYAVEILKWAHMVNCSLILPLHARIFLMQCSSLIAYSDADWAGCPTTRRSTSGYCVFLGNNLLSSSSKRQPTLSRSSAEVEYHGVANAVADTCWLRNLLRELHSPLSSATLVSCDNVSVVCLSSNPVQRQRTKHIEIDIHFVRDLVVVGQVIIRGHIY